MAGFRRKTIPKINIRSKRNDKLTFVVMGGPDARIRDYTVSVWFIKFCMFCFTVFCFALVAFGAVSYYIVQEYADDRVTLAALFDENAILIDTTENQAEMIDDLQKIAGNMLNKIEEIASLNTEVRSMVGLEESTEGASQVVAGYHVSRGESIVSEDLEGVDEELDTLEDLMLELYSMDMKMTEQAMELLLLKDDVDKQLAFEAALPSLWPMEGVYISAFGNRRSPISGRIEFHQGIDIANKSGTKIYAAGDGVVTFAGYRNGWGRMVMINHGYGYVSQYAHCSSIDVLEGQVVSKGDYIAACGSTGRTTGSHLHYGIQYDGAFIDPMTILLPDGN